MEMDNSDPIQDASPLVREMLARREQYLKERDTLTEQIKRGEIRIERVRELIFSCEKLLEEEGYTSFRDQAPPVSQSQPTTEPNNKANGRPSDTECVLRIITAASPESLLSGEITKRVNDAGYEIAKKAVYRALYTLRKAEKIKRVRDKYSLAR
jgi:hypothetical protein